MAGPEVGSIGAVLLILLGIQVLALGLIGGILIFVSGKRIKDYP